MMIPRHAFSVRFGAAALSVLLLTTLTVPTALAAAPVVDECYYATLDHHGGLTEGGVVKSFQTNGNEILTDLGNYDAVVNLTDRTEPVLHGQKVIFDLGEAAPETFYFEGKTAQPYEELPFRIDLSYRMNGLETDPEDMAGQTGVGEVHLDLSPNPNASEYAKNNFVLMALSMFRGRDLISLEAPGGQVQKIGDMEAVVYMALPGETQHFELRIGSEDFSFGGFTFLVQPATLAQMEEITALRGIKDKTEDSYHAITESVETILDRVDGLDQTLSQTASGLDQLDHARSAAASGAKPVMDQADRTLNAMTDLSQSLSPVVGHLKAGKQALAELSAVVDQMTDSMSDLRPDLKAIRRAIEAIQDDLNDLDALLSGSRDETEQLYEALDRLEQDLAALQEALGQLQGASEVIRSMLQPQPIEDLAPLTVQVGDQAYRPEELEGMLAASALLWDCCTSVGQDTSTEVPRTEEALLAYVEEHKTALIAKVPECSDPEDPAQAELLRHLEDPEATKVLVHLHVHKRTISKQIEAAQKFNQLIQRANDSIHQVNGSIDSVLTPVGHLLDALNALTDTLQNGLLQDSQTLLASLRAIMEQASAWDSPGLHQDVNVLLDHTQTLLGQADALLDQGKAVTDTLKTYKPTVQAALDDAIHQAGSAVDLLDELNDFSRDLEGLVQTTAPKANDGAKAALGGMSDSMRQMASGMEAADDARTAGSAVQDLIESTWNDYTGDKNRMLNMDPNAPKVSLTSAQNRTPNSIQLILRSEGIQVDPAAKAAAEAEAAQKTTLWDRIARMFRDFAAIFTGD